MIRVTDEERREVARRLRGNPEDTLIPHRTGRHHGMGCHEAADRFWDMCDRIKAAGNYDIAFSTTSVLADLIEPDEPQVKRELKYRSRCDELGAEMKRQRDALLALADDLDYAGAAVENVAYIDQTFHDAARRIREALGVCYEE